MDLKSVESSFRMAGNLFWGRLGGLYALYNAMNGWGCSMPASVGIVSLTIYLTNARKAKQRLA